MSNEFGDIIEEIKSLERREWFNRLAIAILIIALGVMGIIAGKSFINYKKIQNTHQEEEKLSQILRNASGLDIKDIQDKSKGDDIKTTAEKLEELSKTGSSIYSLLAAYYGSNLCINQGQFSKAALIYQEIADNQSYDQVVRDYSALDAINAKLIGNQIDEEGALKEIDKYLLTSDNKVIKKRSFYLSSLLTKAAILGHLGKWEEELEVLNLLINNSTGEDNITILAKSMRQYAQYMRSSENHS